LPSLISLRHGQAGNDADVRPVANRAGYRKGGGTERQRFAPGVPHNSSPAHWPVAECCERKPKVCNPKSVSVVQLFGPM
jgi:hypothetical protein